MGSTKKIPVLLILKHVNNTLNKVSTSSSFSIFYVLGVAEGLNLELFYLSTLAAKKAMLQAKDK